MSNHDSSKTAIFALAPLVAFNLYVFSGNWGGDPEIHIIFARNFLNGGFLEFNLGSPTSGETSPIYMLVVAFISKMFSAEIVPFFMKLLSIIALIFAIIFSTEPIKNLRMRIIVAFYCLAVPSLLFQGFLGMENMLFAAVFVLLIRTMTYHLGVRRTSLIYNIIICTSPVFLYFLRPEAIFIGLFGAILALLRGKYLHLFTFLTSLLIIYYLNELVHIISGVPLHGAGKARTVFCNSETVSAYICTGWEVYFSKKPLYFVLMCSGLIGSIMILLKHYPKIYITKDYIAIMIVILGPLGLHFLNFFPNTHFSRYILYAFFSMVFVASMIIGNAQEVPNRLKNSSIFVLCLFAFIIFVVEHSLRSTFDRALTHRKITEITSLQSEKTKKNLSDAICDKVDFCETDGIVLANVEVQIRLRLDERFTVASLDGITDFKFLDFILPNGCIDLFGYLRFRSVNLLWSFPDYTPKNKNCGKSLRDVQAIVNMGQSIVISDLIFEPIKILGKTRAVIRKLN
jgi:hypothetical protein